MSAIACDGGIIIGTIARANSCHSGFSSATVLSVLRHRAAPHRAREIVEQADDAGDAEEFDHAAEVRRRTLAEEDAGVERQLIAAVGLGQEADDGQVVAEDPDAALGRLALRRDRGHGVRAVADRGEQIELDGRAQRRRALVGLRGIEEQLR